MDSGARRLCSVPHYALLPRLAHTPQVVKVRALHIYIYIIASCRLRHYVVVRYRGRGEHSMKPVQCCLPFLAHTVYLKYPLLPQAKESFVSLHLFSHANVILLSSPPLSYKESLQ